MDKDPSQASPQLDDEKPRDAAELRGEIQQTRSELGDTVAALAAKTDVKAQAHQAAQEVKDNVAETVNQVKQDVSDKRARLSATAHEAAPDSAQQAGRQAAGWVSANRWPLIALAAFGAGLLAGKRSR